jgi:hypothetical protein
MIVYKVVDKKSRYGSNAAIYMKINNLDQNQFKKQIEGWRISNYFPKYKKDEIVKYVKRSPGIMCFENPNKAKQFIMKENIDDVTEIIKVKGIDMIYDGNRRFDIVRCVGSKPFDIYTMPNLSVRYITFKEVEVLE